MRKKLFNILNKAYGVLMSASFFAGILPLIPLIVAIIIGSSTDYYSDVPGTTWTKYHSGKLNDGVIPEGDSEETEKQNVEFWYLDEDKEIAGGKVKVYFKFDNVIDVSEVSVYMNSRETNDKDRGYPVKVNVLTGDVEKMKDVPLTLLGEATAADTKGPVVKYSWAGDFSNNYVVFEFETDAKSPVICISEVEIIGVDTGVPPVKEVKPEESSDAQTEGADEQATEDVSVKSAAEGDGAVQKAEPANLAGSATYKGDGAANTTVGNKIFVFIKDSYYPWVILVGSVSVVLGLIAMYIGKLEGLSVKKVSADHGADKETDKKDDSEKTE